MTFLNTIVGRVLDTLFPIYCLGCKTIGSNLCMKCLLAFPMAEREGLPWVYPVYDYRHPPVKKSLWHLKYKNKKTLAQTFANILYDKILEELSELSIMENFRDPLLIPIPLSKERYQERGYNQAELIAKKLVVLDKNTNFTLLTDILIKIKDVEHQARIQNRSKRLRNIVGSFAIQHGKEYMVQKRNIILIDDILTTGATLSEAKNVLKQAGARKIIGFTIAH